ncbi:hypothetical protein [Enterococcus sp. UD-01]|jgi:hypothetical protein|uniref:hypothetical protein n=1 Tax=Enterococcus sp. UD-01 TaxID=3373911 RepID=UPI003836FCC1
MKFKNVILSEEEAMKWAEYFAEMYPEKKGRVGEYSTWSGMTVNEDQTVFVKTNRVNQDNSDEVWFYYYWYGCLFIVQMERIWGEEDLEGWEFDRIMTFPNNLYGPGIHLSEKLKSKKEQIFQDLKEAMIVYGRDGTQVSNPPIPNIQILVEGRAY